MIMMMMMMMMIIIMMIVPASFILRSRRCCGDLSKTDRNSSSLIAISIVSVDDMIVAALFELPDINATSPRVRVREGCKRGLGLEGCKSRGSVTNQNIVLVQALYL